MPTMNYEVADPPQGTRAICSALFAGFARASLRGGAARAWFEPTVNNEDADQPKGYLRSLISTFWGVAGACLCLL